MKEFKVVGRFYQVAVCVSCLNKLSNQDEYHSKGYCPYCFHSSGGTICDTYTMGFREIYTCGSLLGLIRFRIKTNVQASDFKSMVWAKYKVPGLPILDTPANTEGYDLIEFNIIKDKIEKLKNERNEKATH